MVLLPAQLDSHWGPSARREDVLVRKWQMEFEVGAQTGCAVNIISHHLGLQMLPRARRACLIYSFVWPFWRTSTSVKPLSQHWLLCSVAEFWRTPPVREGMLCTHLPKWSPHVGNVKYSPAPTTLASSVFLNTTQPPNPSSPSVCGHVCWGQSPRPPLPFLSSSLWSEPPPRGISSFFCLHDKTSNLIILSSHVSKSTLSILYFCPLLPPPSKNVRIPLPSALHLHW